MHLTGAQFYKLQQALISAFPSRSTLRQMTRVRMDLVLETVADGADHAEVVFNLITWAEAQGRLAALLDAARADNPGNPDLRAVVDEIRAPPPPPPVRDLSPYATIRDSGAEATVAAFATVTALETSLAVRGQPARLSPRYLYEKAKRHDELGGAEGTFLTSVIYIAEHFGVPLEATWPYRAGERALPRKTTWDKLDAATAYRGRFYRLDSYEQIAPHLDAGRPVIAGLPVYNSWFGPEPSQTGRIPRPAPNESLAGGHAVTIVAFDPATRGIRFANSWGTDWGDHGFGSMDEATARAHLFDGPEGDQLWAVEVVAGRLPLAPLAAP